jgi:hypothetical protein
VVKQDVRLEPGDLRIIRRFVKDKLNELYKDDFTDEQCVDELINYLYYYVEKVN